MPNFTSMLPWWGWTLMLAVPPAIIALYFLKLKRQPVEVPSTYLWLKSIEDLHVNSLWQKLRQSLLLLLQLLLLLFAILALLRPSWSATATIGNRSIFLIDVSASMGAKDVEPTRLEEVKRQVRAMIDQMESNDKAMIITFADEARVVHPYTDSRNALRAALDKIQVTDKPTSMLEALRVAAGLANPGQTASDPTDVQVADALEATLYIFTDGNFDPPDFSLGNLEPKYMKIGNDDAQNVAVAAFSVEASEERPQEMQAFARLENYGPEDAVVRVDLYLDGAALDAKEIEIPAGDTNGVVFTMDSVETGVLKLVVNAQDDLAVDNEAWAARNTPRQALILLVTDGNGPLELCLRTERAAKRMLVQLKPPSFLDSEDYRRNLGAGYDLVIFDNCLPRAKEDDDTKPTPMPLANTWFIGTVPKLPAWGWEPGKPWPPEKKDVPLVLDVERAHPIMEYVAMGNVRFGAGIPLGKPSGGTTLIDTDEGPILTIAPREGFEDLVLGVNLTSEEPETNWQLKLSFPVFVLNVAQYLGGVGDSVAARSIRPGESLELRPETSKEELKVRGPDKQDHDIARSPQQNAFLFSHADVVGPYEVRDGDNVLQTFTANLFDSRESNLKPAKAITTTWNREGIQPEQSVEPARREIWKWLLLLALGVCLFEWYIYNRRVYL